MTRTAVVLIAHGTVESLDDLPTFLANIRRGHAPPPELLAEVRRRYEAIGGRSPLLDVCRDVARKLEAEVELPVRIAMRLFHPYPEEMLAELGEVDRLVVVPLAQHSAPIYAASVRAAVKDRPIEVLAAGNWGRIPELTHAYADAVLAALPDVPAEEIALVLTAHSLPVAVVRAGDPYEQEVRGSAADILAEVRARGGRFAEERVCFQSQGMGGNMEWLGPELRPTLEELARAGRKHVVIAPIGFLADHVEILYDLDIEAKAWAGELGIVLHRTTSLNAGSGLIEALAAVTRSVLAG